MYDPNLVDPMRRELTDLGVTELRTQSEVKQALESLTGTALVVVNSVCGCSAGGMRPAVGMALKNVKKPSKVFTVFAGQDKEATEEARKYFTGYPPSSPSIALLKNGELVAMIQRRDIEGFSAPEIAEKLTTAFNSYCS